jgi:CRP-like cAMP-binding protein
MTVMHTPAFFDAVPAIVVADPLAETLGAAEGGLIEYRYVDAVRLAGRYARQGLLRRCVAGLVASDADRTFRRPGPDRDGGLTTMALREIAPEVFLASVPLFKLLGTATLARLAAATTPARGPRLAGIVGPGQSFGEPVMFLERPAVVDAQAASDALLLHVPKEAVFDAIDRNPKFARRVIAGLSQRIESLVRELDRQALGSGSERFIDYSLRRGRGQAGAVVVTLPAAKAEIASQLNLTPEQLSRILHELAQAGLLQVQGRNITVSDPNRLKRKASRR